MTLTIWWLRGTTGGLKSNISHSSIKSSSFTPRLCVPLNLYIYLNSWSILMLHNGFYYYHPNLRLEPASNIILLQIQRVPSVCKALVPKS